MAFSAKSLLLIFIMLSSMFINPEASECNSSGNGCFYAKGSAASLLEVHSINRKLLYGNLERGVKVPTSSNIGNEEGKKYTVDWELRRVPSGPDPLHHNGGSPKKPKTTP